MQWTASAWSGCAVERAETEGLPARTAKHPLPSMPAHPGLPYCLPARSSVPPACAHAARLPTCPPACLGFLCTFPAVVVWCHCGSCWVFLFFSLHLLTFPAPPLSLRPALLPACWLQLGALLVVWQVRLQPHLMFSRRARSWRQTAPIRCWRACAALRARRAWQRCSAGGVRALPRRLQPARLCCPAMK